jgi:hypothetical protein
MPGPCSRCTTALFGTTSADVVVCVAIVASANIPGLSIRRGFGTSTRTLAVRVFSSRTSVM